MRSFSLFSLSLRERVGVRVVRPELGIVRT
jgi:hypothetical protein